VSLSSTFGLPGKVTKTSSSYYVPLVFGNGIITFNKNWEFLQHTASVDIASNNNNFKYIGNVLEHSNAKWVATRGGLAKCDDDLKLKKLFVPKTENAITGDVQKMRDLIELSDSEILIKSFSAIFIFNTNRETFTKSFYTTTDDKYDLLNCFIVEVVIADKQCYLATELGLLQLDIETGKLTKIELPNNNTRLSAIVLKNKELWIGSQTGLTSYNIETKKAITYYKKDGLSNDNVLFMRLGVDNKLWVSTSNGLCCFDTETKKTANIFEKDGLVENYLQGEIFVDDNGNVALGNSKGLSFIKKEILTKANEHKASYITELLVNNNQLNWQFKNNEKFIALSKDQNNISIHFTMSNATSNETYFYKLNNTWYNTSTGLIQLNSLEAGTYTLQVSNLPVDNELNDFITIFVKPPFYSTWWFYILSTILLGGILYAFYRIRIRSVRREAMLQKTYAQKLTESEMQTLRSQMNPHFMFNTLNSINSYIIQNKTAQASDYLTTFSKLMRSILELSKQEKVTIVKELAALKMYIELEALRLENKFDYSIIIDDDVDEESIKIPSLIIQPFVENAIWHGLHNKKTQGHIDIKIKETAEHNLEITIEDDGIGRKASEAIKQDQVKHKSFGIDITINRVKLLNNNNSVTFIDLYDEHNIAAGTKVTILLNTQYND
jgi:two-component sensor histidine kinase